jgi:uncharacterized protein (DUF3820 family)
VKPDQQLLIKIAHTKMPFGKYKGRFLSDLPEPYLVWFKQQGFPKGQLGEMLQFVYELKLNGLEYILKDIQKNFPIDDL